MGMADGPDSILGGLPAFQNRARDPDQCRSGAVRTGRRQCRVVARHVYGQSKSPAGARPVSVSPPQPRSSVVLEICADCLGSAQAAAAGGADRLELCANLPEGGTTPSAGLIRVVRTVFPGRLMILIRPRGYDFLYSEPEMDAMLHDIHAARTLGADGVVIGCLTPEGWVDKVRCRRLIGAAEGLDITFHRAFDMTQDLFQALEDVMELGI